MPDDFSMLIRPRQPVPGRPLNGQTILAVEDSRFACEAIRLLCLRSGARIRRADSLRAARRHLQTYRPCVAIVDIGLPDGSGTDLIRELAAMRPRIPALIATSGDPAAEDEALAAGADLFLAKPLDSLRAFQTAIARLMAGSGAVPLPAREDEPIRPDPLALRDDITAAHERLRDADAPTLGYLASFVSGVARSTADVRLEEAAGRAAREARAGQTAGPGHAALTGILAERLRHAPAL